MTEVGPPVHVVLATWAALFSVLVAGFATGAWVLARILPSRSRPGAARASVWGGLLLAASGVVLMRVQAWGGQNEEVAFVLFAAALVAVALGGWALWRGRRK